MMKNGWQEKSLKEICIKITDGSHNSPQSVNSGLPMASVKDLTPHGINLESCRLISKEDFEKLVKYDCKPQKGDVLIAKDGATALDTVCQINEELEVVLLSSVAILRPDTNIVTTSFLRYFMDSPITRKYLKGGYITGAAIPRIVLEDFKRAPIRYPSKDKQERITSILSAYDDLMENNMRRIKILEEIARLIYREWFVEFKAPGIKLRKATPEEKKVTGKDVFPEEWEVKSIGDVVEILGGGTPSKEKQEYWNDGNITWYTPSDLTKTKMMFALESGDKITEVGLKKSSTRLFPAYSVMMTSRATIGVVAINTNEASTNQGFIICIPTKDIPMHYLYYWVLSNVERSLNNATGSTYKEIIKSVYRGFPIIIPLKRVMNKFVDIQSPMFKQLESLIRQNINLRQTRDLLLPKLISGEVEV
jgi:type I restriction enzyme S subunit